MKKPGPRFVTGDEGPGCQIQIPVELGFGPQAPDPEQSPYIRVRHRSVNRNRYD